MLRGRTIINCFFENSTRTRTSFEVAGKRLGGDVINMAVAVSSMVKGETLIDTAMTLNAMHPDVLVVRHPESGAVQLLSEKVDCAVINAGDGSHEHPTQALLDALTIRRRKGRLDGLLVAICGDILHSRVARSNIALLNIMGARVRVVAPRTLLPAAIERLGVEVFHDMAAGLAGVDIVMMLRLQSERMHGSFVPSTREYFHFFGLDYEKLRAAKPDALIMHPGPMNRGVEIGSEIADDIDRSLIRHQVEMGVAVRMACLEILTGDLGDGPPPFRSPASGGGVGKGREPPADPRRPAARPGKPGSTRIGDLLVEGGRIAAVGGNLAGCAERRRNRRPPRACAWRQAWSICACSCASPAPSTWNRSRAAGGPRPPAGSRRWWRCPTPSRRSTMSRSSSSWPDGRARPGSPRSTPMPRRPRASMAGS